MTLNHNLSDNQTSSMQSQKQIVQLTENVPPRRRRTAATGVGRPPSARRRTGGGLIKASLLPLHYSPHVSLFYRAFIKLIIIYITLAAPCAVLPLHSY